MTCMKELDWGDRRSKGLCLEEKRNAEIGSEVPGRSGVAVSRKAAGQKNR
jgi:hypothetical protein